MKTQNEKHQQLLCLLFSSTKEQTNNPCNLSFVMQQMWLYFVWNIKKNISNFGYPIKWFRRTQRQSRSWHFTHKNNVPHFWWSLFQILIENELCKITETTLSFVFHNENHPARCNRYNWDAIFTHVKRNIFFMCTNFHIFKCIILLRFNFVDKRPWTSSSPTNKKCSANKNMKISDHILSFSISK